MVSAAVLQAELEEKGGRSGLRFRRVHLHQAVHLGETGADGLGELAEVNRRRIVTRARPPRSRGALDHLPPPSDTGAQVEPPQFSELRQDPQNTRPQHLGHLTDLECFRKRQL